MAASTGRAKEKENTRAESGAAFQALLVRTKEMKHMRAMMFLLLAVLPPAATWAQKGIPAAPNATAQSRQAAAQPGESFCGHAMDAATFIDARATMARARKRL